MSGYGPEEAICRLFRSLDHHDYQAVLTYFDEDAIWERREGSGRGREEIRKLLEMRSPTLHVRHVLSNAISDRLSASEVLVTMMMVVFSLDTGQTPVLPAPLGGARAIASIEARVVRRHAGWRVAHLRVAEVSFRAA